jgi:hypothetical protein
MSEIYHLVDRRTMLAVHRSDSRETVLWRMTPHPGTWSWTVSKLLEDKLVKTATDLCEGYFFLIAVLINTSTSVNSIVRS